MGIWFFFETVQFWYFRVYRPSENIRVPHNLKITWQVEQKLGGRGRGREWATLGVHPLSWLLSNNGLEKVPFVSVPHTSSNRLLLSNQDKGCTPSVAHSLALPLGPTLLNLWTFRTEVLLCSSNGSSVITYDAEKSSATSHTEVFPMIALFIFEILLK